MLPSAFQAISHCYTRPAVCRFAFAVAILAMAQNVEGQVKPKEGDEVKVLFLRDWHDGVVIGRKGDKYGVQYEFGGTAQQRMFTRSEIRMMCEVNAMDLARNWASNNGQFKVEAALLKIEDDSLVLVKTDLKAIKVPLAKLSSKDLAYIEKFKKSHETAVAKGEIPARTAELPEIENFSSTLSGAAVVGFGEEKVGPLGKIPTYLADFKQAGIGFTFPRKRQELVAVIPVGGPEQLVLMTAYENNFFNKEAKFPSQLYWISLKQQKVVGTLYITPDDYALDYDPRSKTLVSIQELPEHAIDNTYALTTWRLSPGAKKIEPVVRWHAQFEWRDSKYVKVINDKIILAKTDRNTYIAWDTTEKKELYALRSRSFFDVNVVLTSDRKFLLLPEDGSVSIINAETGELIYQLRVNDGAVSGVGVNDSGTKIAALTATSLYVWNLDSGDNSPKIYKAPMIGNPFSARLAWVDDDHVIVEGFDRHILFRLSLELPVWSYTMDVRQKHLNSDPLRSMILNGHFMYVAQPEVFGGSIALGAVKLPGPSVDEVTANLVKEDLYSVKSGSLVSLGSMEVSDPEKVRQWLTEKISQCGWKLDDKAEIVIDCKMGRGQQQTETYRAFGARSNNSDTTVTYTPYFSNLTIRKGSAILWRGGISTGAPHVVHGGNIQGQIDLQQQPQLQFFESIVLPNQILDPRFGSGFGISSLGLKGIEVKSTQPAGRAEDPDAARRQFQKEKESSRNQ